MHYNSLKSRYLRVMLLSLVFLLTAGQLNAKVVYFKNIIPYNSPWEQPYVHYFGGQDGTSWPGKAMEHVEGDWWKYDIGNNNGVVFNNGGNGQQTYDLTVNNDTETAFVCSHWDGEQLRGNWTTYTPTVWTIVGHSAIVNGGEWNLSNTDNDMVKGDDGTYSLTIENKTINAGNYEYKVAKDHSWDGAFPASGNYTLIISEAGDYTIVYTYDGASSLTATATKKVTKVETPTFSPAGGTYNAAQNVTIACATEGATIYYTTDGSNPTTSSTQYTGAITVNATTTLKAIAAKDGMDNSEVAEATYTIELPAPATYYLKHPWGGGNWDWEELTANGDGTYSVTAQYGGDNAGFNWGTTKSSTTYIDPTSNKLIRYGNPAKGDECTFTLNPTAETITITKKVAKVETPTFDPAGGTYHAAQSVTIACATDGATIYYTTDGNNPTTSSTQYSGAIAVNATTTLKAIAAKDGMTASDVASATYTIELPQTGHLYIKVGDGAYTEMDASDGNFTWQGDINNEQIIKFSSNGTDDIEYHLASSGDGHYWINSDNKTDSNPKFGNGSDYIMKNGNGNYTVTVSHDYSSVTFVKNEVPITHTVMISGGLNINGNWTTTGKVLSDNNDGIFTYTFTATNDINKYFRVQVDNKFIGGNTISLQLNDPVEYYENAADNFEFHISSTVNLVNGSEYTLVINTNNNTIRINGTGGHTANEIPVYPLGVQSETELAAYDFEANPVIYLLSEVLNHERVSPEWQMTLGADGQYHLDGFAMRTTNCHTGKGESTEQKYVFARKYTAIDIKQDLGTTTVDEGNVHLSEGELYNATFNPNDNTLTLTKVGKHMPFISLVGNAMVQDQNYTTPRGSQSDYGWSEGWLQYDENGKLLKDRSGNVMYSTMWPPRYPVYFTANIGGERTYSSEQMTFKAQNDYVAKTGAEWKAELMASENGEAYNNLGTGDYELEDDVEYVRYVVPDIWYVGAAKIWTGWTGRTNDNGDAQWSNHANWGYGDKELGSGGDQGTTVVPEMPYYLSTQTGYNGNFYFETPTYFKTIEFFYNTTKSDESRLYTTLAFGKAQIEAQSHKDGDKYDHGMYKPTVSPDEGVTAQSYIIRCYDAATGKLVTLNDGIVAQGEGNPSNANFLNDREGLAEGKYYYEMEVVFQTANGTRTATVRSNPFIIYFPGVYTTETQSYQLLKLESAMNGYNYLTVAQDTEKGAIYAANLNADGQVTEVAAITSEQRAAAVDQYENRANLYTDRVLVLAPVPAQFKLDAEKSSAEMTIVNYSLDENANEVVDPQTDGSMAYVFQQGHMGNVNHKAVMNYTTTVAGSTTDKQTMGKEVSTYMVRPNPVAGDAQVEVVKEENGTILEGKEVSYYKVNANKSFMDPNTENVDVDYSIAGNDNTYRMTGDRGVRGIAITNLDPAATSQATVVVKYRNADGNYTLEANKFAPVEFTSSEVAIKEGERSIPGAEITYDKNYSPKWGKLVSAITAFGITETTAEKIGNTNLEVELYEPKVYVDGGERAYGFYTMDKANVTIAEKTYFTAEELGEMNTDPKKPEEIKYYFDNGKTGNDDLIEVKIAIAPVYPILVDPAVSLTGINTLHAAPALKDDNLSKITTLNGKAAEYIINPNDIITGINDIVSKAVQSVHFVNVAGQMSDKPFEGVNIVVTKYTDGSTQAVKMVK